MGLLGSALGLESKEEKVQRKQYEAVAKYEQQMAPVYQKMMDMIQNSHARVVMISRPCIWDTQPGNVTVMCSDLTHGYNDTFVMSMVEAMNIMYDLGYRLETFEAGFVYQMTREPVKEYVFVRQ